MENQPFCRICRGSDEEEILYQPCKCNGSVRFIHQSCLQQWLTVSQKRNCELCHFEFVFTPVYADNAPDRIPILVVCRRVFLNFGSHFIKFTRFTTISILWLVLIPWILFLVTFSLFNTISSISHPVERLALASLFPNSEVAAEVLEGQIIYISLISVALILFFAKELLGLEQLDNPNRLERERERQRVMREQIRAQLLRQENGVDLAQPIVPLNENNHTNEGTDEPRLLSIEERRELARLRIERLEERLRAQATAQLASSESEADSEDSSSSEGSNSTSEIERQVPDPIVAPEPIRVEIPLPQHEDNNPESISELLGYSGPLYHVFYTSGIVLACLIGLVFIAGYLPYALGYFSLYSLTKVDVFSKYFQKLVSLQHIFSNLLGHDLNSIVPLSSNWIESKLLNSNSWSPRFFVIGVGYGWITILSVIFLAIVVSSNNNRSFLARAVKLVDSKLKHFFKIALFLSIELVVFPLFSGVMLDIVTIYVLEQSMIDRIAFHYRYPIVSFFLHWFVGTVFMFNFSTVVDKIRQVIRPGVLWFLRDPNDAEFKPIKEIIEQPVIKQFKKLAVSAVMYSGFIVIGYGGFLTAISSKYSPLKLTPFRTDFGTLTEFPLDLLVFHFFLPVIYKLLQPKDKIRILTHRIIASLSYLLQLTSFMFGGRFENEEIPFTLSRILGSIKSLFQNLPRKQIERDDSIFSSKSLHANLTLVPAKDSMKLPKTNRKSFHVIKDIDEGNAIATSDGFIKEQWTFVVTPSYLRLRLWIFFFMFWIILLTLCTIFSSASLKLGRILLDFTFSKGVAHDLYSLLFGSGLVASLIILVTKFKEIFSIFSYDFTSSVRGASAISYVILMVLVVLPFLSMSVFSLYFMMPGQIHNEKNLVRFYLHEWAIGIIYVRVIYVFIELGPNNQLRPVINRILNTGWTSFDFGYFNKAIVFPYISKLVLAHLIPYAFAILSSQMLRTFI
eukprot:NODE_159_length_15043_cov_0.440444.p2 type:complete len:960 gc:universal NODE_159_length_15043_cov_0.440444:12697-9818(-)